MSNPPAPSPGVGDPGYQYGQLTPIVNAFLGYRPQPDELDDFPFEIYRFIIRSLRDNDQNEAIGGTRLLERFLLGPQEVWFNLFLAGSKLNTIFDPEEIDEPYLRALATLVGFGSDLIDIVGIATKEELRRIIAGAIEFWKQRWLDLGVVAAIRLITGNRFKIRDFFDFRFIVGETRIEEDLKNTDPNMISVKTRNFFRTADDGETWYDTTPYTFHSDSQLPKTDDIGGYIVIFDDVGTPTLNGFYEVIAVDCCAEIWYIDSGIGFPRAATSQSWFIAFPYDEYITEIRVVDEKTGQGEVNRNLLEKLLAQQRPSSERFNIVYVDFLDLFQVPNDLGQWGEYPGPSSNLTKFLVEDGKLILASTGLSAGVALTNRPTADWKNFQWKSKAALGSSTGLIAFLFYFEDIDNYLQLLIEYTGFGTGKLYLYEMIGGSSNLLDTWNHPSLNTETFWTYTIETYNYVSGDVRIRIFVDGNLVIDEISTPTYTSGNIAFMTLLSSELWVEETELWEYPLDISRIGPNP